MREFHPYQEYIPQSPRAMIVGSFPIGKFSNPKRRNEIRPNEYDFFFGGEKNLLWKILSEVFNKKINQKEDIIQMLEEKGIAIGDVIKSCVRKNGGAADADLKDIEWNETLLKVIRQNKIQLVYFTSKKVEFWFKRLFKDTGDLQMITLISPSAQTLRSLWQREDFKKWQELHPKTPKIRFIIRFYRLAFKKLT